MTMYEVEVKTVSTVFYAVEAESEDEARKNWRSGSEEAEFIETEDVISALPYDDRFDEDDLYPEWVDEDDDSLIDHSGVI